VNALGRRIAAAIRQAGPISVATYMAAALGDPEHGYYTRRQPIGLSGDFITAPEVSQIFGELLGLWCAATWELMGRPPRAVLVELGPGRGTLMADALRAMAAVPAMCAAVEIHLVETSPTLRAVQAETLRGIPVRWCERLAEVPDAPLLLLANELFDALAVRQFQRGLTGWHERLIALTADGAGFRFVLSPLAVPESGMGAPVSVAGAPLQSIVEVCPGGLALAQEIGERVARAGGAALIVDYGTATTRLHETLQAVRRHGSHPVLAAPGEADLAAHVDFGALAAAARRAGAITLGPIEQGVFFGALGIAERLTALERGATPAQRAALRSGAARLTDPGQMGSLFKVLAIAHPALTDLPGLPRPC